MTQEDKDLLYKVDTKVHTKWEYKEIFLSMVNDNTSDFNTLGEEGWEMCGYDAKYGVAVFKRIKK